MKNVCQLDGQAWFEFETDEDAEQFEYLSATMVGTYYRTIRNHEDRAGAKYYGLMYDDRFVCPVVLCVGDAFVSRDGILIAGFRNDNPFPAFKEQISALGKAIGVEFREDHYTYKHRPPVDIALAEMQHDHWLEKAPPNTSGWVI